MCRSVLQVVTARDCKQEVLSLGIVLTPFVALGDTQALWGPLL